MRTSTSMLEPGLEERARVARELHDSVAQSLYSINLSASLMLTLLERNETRQVRGIVEDLLRQATEAQTQLRWLLQDLWSDDTDTDTDIGVLHGGFTGALARQAADLQARAGCDVSLSVAGEPDLTRAAKAALVRVSREALRNVAKHAPATHVDLVLEVGPAEVMLLVADAGGGFDAAAGYPGHFGLQLMREQARMAGGKLELSSAPGRGTQVRVRVRRSTT